MKAKHLFPVLVLICYAAYTGNMVCAQEPLQYWRNPDAMLQDQASLLFEQAHKILAANPPSTFANDERRLALFSIDALLHDTRLDNGRAFLDYIGKRYRHVADQLGNEKPDGEYVRIYRLYNHGFVVQSSSVTIGIDIIRGGQAGNPFVSDSLIKSVVDRCDILFITHAHGDHTDKSVVQMFCDQHKYVIAPPGLLENTSLPIKYMRGEKKILIPVRNISLTVSVFPGHQEDMPNNVYAVTTPEGVTVMHTGDQENSDDMEWIAGIGNEVEIDVLLVHSWMPEIKRAVEGISPGLILVGHENEMEHTIDHRESYWLTFRRFREVGIPYAVMAWGEHYTVLARHE